MKVEFTTKYGNHLFIETGPSMTKDHSNEVESLSFIGQLTLIIPSTEEQERCAKHATKRASDLLRNCKTTTASQDVHFES